MCLIVTGSGSQRRRVKSAGEKKTNTSLLLEGDKEVAIMMIIVIINKVLLFFQIDHNPPSYTNLRTSYFFKLFMSFLEVFPVSFIIYSSACLVTFHANTFLEI